MVTKIINAIIVDDGLHSGKSVYIENGKILAVACENLPCDEVYDAEGAYLSAGWIDIHTHGGGGYDFMDGGSEPIVKGAEMHLRHGTTSIFPTTLSASQKALEGAVADIKEAMSFPTVRGAHLEGPCFNPISCGAQNSDYIRGFDFDEIESLIADGTVKRIDYAPELVGSAEITEMLTSHGIVTAIGHSSAMYEELLPAYEKGCRLITHLYSATSTVVRIDGYRHLGIIESAFLLKDMTVEVIADGSHLPPELLRMIYQIKGADNICMVTDSMRAAGMSDGEYILGNVREGVPCIREDGVAKLPDRSAFAGSVATADMLVRTMYKSAGVSLADTVKMITKTPARVMGLATKGTIAPKYDADIVVFDDEIDVKQVFVNGIKML